MCGITGYFGKNGTENKLREMTDMIRRRGPDDEGFYTAPDVGFGFRRLSIIDVAGGHQPLSNEDGSIWVMLNGEIFGYKILMEDLMARGHGFKTKSDTEVIAHGYEQYGDAVFEKLNGMFAIAIWDASRQRLVLARDRLGKKPLYWTVKNGTLWFASELKALLAAGVVDRDIDPMSLALYFRTDCVPTPRTIFKNSNKLEPATAMAWSDGHIEKTWRFWEPNIQPLKPQVGSDGDVVSALSGLIDKAVGERLMSDVPLGLFLSGGLDSAVVAESAARQGGRMQAFTIGFDDPTHDESGAARKTASALGLDHHVQILTANDALSMIDQATQLLDEPLADASILPTLLLSRFTRQYVTVALSGDGGDELLLGYQHVPAHQLMNAVPRPTSRVAEKIFKPLLDLVPAGNGYFSLGFKAQRLARGFGASDPWSRDVRWRGAMTGTDLSTLLLPEVSQAADVDYAEKQLAERAHELAAHYVQRTADDGFWRQWSWAYLRTFLMDEVMVKVDRATMWYSLEGRAPLLDTRVVEFLINLPSAYKLRKWKGKRLFKEILSGKVPRDVLEKPKHGFAVPVGKWLNSDLAAELNELTSEQRLKNQGLFDPNAVRRMVMEHRSGRVDRRKEMWALFMFQLWYDAWAK